VDVDLDLTLLSAQAVLNRLYKLANGTEFFLFSVPGVNEL